VTPIASEAERGYAVQHLPPRLPKLPVHINWRQLGQHVPPPALVASMLPLPARGLTNLAFPLAVAPRTRSDSGA
jgi:hypothetical protein